MGIMKKRVLIIDDDRSLQTLLVDYLAANNFATESAFTGGEGVDMLCEVRNGHVDIVVLDIMLPDMDGFETLRRIRTVSAVPVIMLTARIDETDRIIGLEMGADDYMHKPFNPRELVARIKAVLRRGHEPSPARIKKDAPESFSAGPFVIDTVKCKVLANGEDLGLSTLEFDIVRELASSPGRPFSRDHLLSIARGREFEAFDRSIDVHISRIRKKIEPDPARPRYIKTVWGKGYAWA
jgi:DNA-binding response OmpR family regulator